MKLALFLLLLADDPLPNAPGKAAFVKVCGDCHGPEVVTGMGHDRQGWKDVVDEMVDKGATANPKQLAEIVDYLVKAFPKKPR
ncbi:MAG: cytochrome c [Acidobacteriota bacterium]